MSFITKSIKKAWNFTKDHWKEIALVAAVVFTAGVATVGFAAFAGVSSFGGFMGAVGTTMWAGVAGAAGTVGLGAGATVPTTAATIAAGTAGTQVGLGAAWGAGSGFGWGVAGKEAAAAAAAKVVPASEMIGYTGIAGTGAPLTEAQVAAQAATADVGAKAATKVAAGEVVKEAGKNTGMEAVKAWGPTIAATVGPALIGLAGDGDDPGGAPIWGSTAGGARKEAKAREEQQPVAGPGTPDVGGPEAAVTPGGGLLNTQISRPLQGNTARRGYDGRPLAPSGEEDDMGLMGRFGGYGYAG